MGESVFVWGVNNEGDLVIFDGARYIGFGDSSINQVTGIISSPEMFEGQFTAYPEEDIEDAGINEITDWKPVFDDLGKAISYA